MVYYVLVSLHWAYTRPTMVAYMRSECVDTSHTHLHADGDLSFDTMEDCQPPCSM